MWDLGVPQRAALILYEDNDACTSMAMAQKPTPRTRHMDIKYFSLCKWVERDLIKLEHVDTVVNMADHYTKQLGQLLYHWHTYYIMGHVLPTYTEYFQRLYNTLKRRSTPPTPTTQCPTIRSAQNQMATAAAKLVVQWTNIVTRTLW